MIAYCSLVFFLRRNRCEKRIILIQKVVIRMTAVNLVETLHLACESNVYKGFSVYRKAITIRFAKL